MRALMMLVLLAMAGTPKEQPMVATPDDAVLKKIEAALPHGWRMTREKDRVVLEGDKPLWSFYFNRINAPVTAGDDAKRQWEAEKKKTPPSHGQIIFRCEEKWSAERIDAAKKKNQAIRDASKPPAPTSKGPSKADWSAARSHDAELENKLETLPWNTGRCSLFLEKLVGVEDETTVVFPEEAARDTFAAWKTVRELLEPLQAR